MDKIHLFYSKNTGLHSVTHSIYIYIYIICGRNLVVYGAEGSAEASHIRTHSQAFTKHVLVVVCAHVRRCMKTEDSSWQASVWGRGFKLLNLVVYGAEGRAEASHIRTHSQAFTKHVLVVVCAHVRRCMKTEDSSWQASVWGSGFKLLKTRVFEVSVTLCHSLGVRVLSEGFEGGHLAVEEHVVVDGHSGGLLPQPTLPEI